MKQLRQGRPLIPILGHMHLKILGLDNDIDMSEVKVTLARVGLRQVLR